MNNVRYQKVNVANILRNGTFDSSLRGKPLIAYSYIAYIIGVTSEQARILARKSLCLL